MQRRDARRLWLITAVVGVLIALLLALTLPRWSRSTSPDAVVFMEPQRPSGAVAWSPPPPPPPPPEPPPPTPLPEGDHRFSTFAHTAVDRADWVGGAVVTCDVSAFELGDATAVDLDRMLEPDHPVDVLSRVGVPQDGVIHLVVTEPEGEATVHAAGTPGAPHRVFKLRWTGAEPGARVGCTSFDEVEAATLTVTVVDRRGVEVQAERDVRIVMIRGCGLAMPTLGPSTPLAIEPGACALRAEVRNPRFPLIVLRGEPVAVRLFPGEHLDVTLVAPDPPPVWQPPDLLEVQQIADLAAWGGSAAIADALDELADRIARGEWSDELFAELMKEVGSGLGDGPREDSPPEATFEMDLSEEEL